MKKNISIWSIVLINITATFGLRFIPIAARYGASAVILWITAAMLFFIPLGLISTELAISHPNEGGIYGWVKKAFGDKCAFIVSWLYWTNNFFYCPALLTFTTITVAFVINPTLAQNKVFICGSILGGLWSITLLHLKTAHAFKWLTRVSGIIGTILPSILLIALGFASAFIWKRPIPTSYALGSYLPNITHIDLVFFTTLMFSMSGIEITPLLVGDIENPRKTYTWAILISAVLIVGIYIIGTIATTFIISPDKIQSTNGLMEAMQLIGSQLNLPFLVTAIAIMLVLENLGSLGIWTYAPIKMFLESSSDKNVLPLYLTKRNKYNIPHNALIIQALVVSAITLATALLPSINVFYETLVLMTTIIYFIPYLFMFLTFLILRHRLPTDTHNHYLLRHKALAWTVGIVGVVSVTFALLLPMIIPPSDLKTWTDFLLYRSEIIGGPLLFIGVGYWIYSAYEKKQKHLKPLT